MTDIVTTALDHITINSSLARALQSTGRDSWGEMSALLGAQDADHEERALKNARARAQEAADAGEPMPESLAQDVFDARRLDEQARIRHDIIASVLDDARARSEYVTEDDIKPALRYLREELQQVIDQTKALTALVGNVRTADEALHADEGVLAAFRELHVVLDRYWMIRRAQQEVMRRVSGWTPASAGNSFELYGLYANSIDIHPHWVGRRSFAERSMNATGSEEDAYRRWLRQARVVPATQHLPGKLDVSQVNGVAPTELTGIDALIAMAHTTRPWIPSPSQLSRVVDLATEATAEFMGHTGVEAAIKARSALYKLAGVNNEYANAKAAA